MDPFGPTLPDIRPETLELTEIWDKTFPKDPEVNQKKVTFVNHYGITLAADLYRKKDAKGLLPAVAVCGPLGAVKEQAGGFYAQELAKRGFLTIAFDPSFSGESGGFPRSSASPDINTEDFLAAVDFLSTSDEADPDRIGILGISGFGGMAVNAASADPRIRACVSVSMYDMSRLAANGFFEAHDSPGDRRWKREAFARQRTEDYRNGFYSLSEGISEYVPKSTPEFVRDYREYYLGPRGMHARSANSNGGFIATNAVAFMNMPQLSFASEIESAVFLIHGEKAHSRYFSETAFNKLRGNNKRLLIIPGATHLDLYDRMDIIPFGEIEAFYNKYLV